MTKGKSDSQRFSTSGRTHRRLRFGRSGEAGSLYRMRCDWAHREPLISYHDLEWGVPLHDDRGHFEYLLLDGAQAGLSWETILKRREGYRRAFDDFDPERVARYDEETVQSLLADPGIIRNRQKIRAAIRNAQAFLETSAAEGGFDDFIWRFTEGRTLMPEVRSWAEIPAESPESRAMSAELRRRGFTFVGPVICYAYMQAAGMVNDHVLSCFRRGEVAGAAKDRAVLRRPGG